ncbi:MAG: 50S ribosomal protein L25 [Spirochaetaceae bacterium]|nr:50S ribosomal protein L25 [Spirochaetaceae bacterium]
MDQLVIKAATRTVMGKSAAKKLRENGRLPAVMYNSKGESSMLDVDEAEFTKVWKLATPTTLVTLDVDGKSKSLAFIKDTEYDIISDKNLHVDFHVIDEDKPLKAFVKLIVSGNPVGVRDGGVFEKSSVTIQIECLPKDLPQRIVVDVNNLGLGEKIAVKDLDLAKGITVLSDPEVVIASVKSVR